MRVWILCKSSRCCLTPFTEVMTVTFVRARCLQLASEPAAIVLSLLCRRLVSQEIRLPWPVPKVSGMFSSRMYTSSSPPSSLSASLASRHPKQLPTSECSSRHEYPERTRSEKSQCPVSFQGPSSRGRVAFILNSQTKTKEMVPWLKQVPGKDEDHSLDLGRHEGSPVTPGSKGNGITLMKQLAGIAGSMSSAFD